VIAAMVQARMGSTRLPGKTLALIAGRPMLGQLVWRARQIPGVEQVVIATTDKPADRAILRFAEEQALPAYTGSEEDVLDRVYQAARHYGVSVIVRVTPDCPLLDPHVSGLVLGRYLEAGGTLDYVSNTHPPTFPDGLDTEVFGFAALERAWRGATPYIWNRPGEFRLANVSHPRDLSALRWTVDEPRDLEFVRAIYARLGAERLFMMDDVLRLLEADPSLEAINAGMTRNDGYAKSVRADRPLTGSSRS
jgi:spore coat polysaccharide biosynthesis protein SpsF (cytidylyltransferase family)